MPNGLAIAGGVSFPILAPDGSAAMPSYSFSSDPNTGIYRVGADSMGLSAGGTLRLTVATTEVTSTVPVVVPLGTGAAPGVQGAGGGAGGLWWIVANQACLGDANAYFRSGNTQLFFFANGVGTGECPSVAADYGFRTPYTFNFSSAGFNTGSDLWMSRLAAASLRIGGAPSATPIANTLTIGEASRPGTDTDVGGANGTIRSGLGTGTGTASSLIFQTPTLAASGTGAQTYATRLTISSASLLSTVPVLAPDATAAAPGFGFGSEATGFYLLAASNIALSIAGTGYVNFGTGPISSASNVRWCWSSGALGGALDLGWARNSAGVLEVNDGTVGTFRDIVARNVFVGALDLGLSRLAAASLRQGLAPSATPVNQTFTIGEASRGGTDLNVAGANGTIRSGLGTGNAPGSSLLFQTPDVGASGTVAQTYATRLTINAQNTTFDLPNQGLRINGQTSGAGVSAGTLTNAPSAGDPSFWLPISIAGNIRYIPCWT